MSSLAEQFICADERSWPGAADSAGPGSGYGNGQRLDGETKDNKPSNGCQAWPRPGKLVRGARTACSPTPPGPGSCPAG
jgi:hypothetical protein